MARNIFTKGTAITLAWHFTKPDGTSFDLSGYQLRLFYGVGSRYTEVSDFTLGTNTNNNTEDFISWVFAADKQVTAGDYKMKLQIYQNGHLFTTMNYNNAFSLFQGTPYSNNDEQQEEEAGVVNLYTAAEYYLFKPIVPTVGTDGYWYVNGVLVLDGDDNPIPSFYNVIYDESTRWLSIYKGDPNDPGNPDPEPVQVIKDVDNALKHWNEQYEAEEGSLAESVAGDSSRWGKYKAAEGTMDSDAGDSDRWGQYKTAENARDEARAAAEGSSSSVAGDGSRWGAYKTAESARNAARLTAEGTSSSTADDGSRWGAYKAAEMMRDSARENVEGSAASEAGDGTRWGAYKTAENNRDAARLAAEGNTGSTAGDGSRWGAYKTAEANRDTARETAEGTALSEAGDGTRWGAYKTAENNRGTAYETAEGTSSATAGDGSRWGSYKTAEASRDTARATAEGTSSSEAGDGTRWGAYKTAEAARDTAFSSAESTRNAGMAPLVGIFDCSTAAATAQKEVTASNYVLSNGGAFKVKFTYANSASSPTLKINSETAKAIVFNGAAASADNTWGAGEVVEFYYDPTYNSNAGGFIGRSTVVSVSQNTETNIQELFIGTTKKGELPTQIINNLTTGGVANALSAEQGKVLDVKSNEFYISNSKAVQQILKELYVPSSVALYSDINKIRVLRAYQVGENVYRSGVVLVNGNTILVSATIDFSTESDALAWCKNEVLKHSNIYFLVDWNKVTQGVVNTIPGISMTDVINNAAFMPSINDYITNEAVNVSLSQISNRITDVDNGALHPSDLSFRPGMNLANPDKIIDDCSVNNQGALNRRATGWKTIEIEVEAGKTYTFGRCALGRTVNGAFYQGDTYISMFTYDDVTMNSGKTVVAPVNANKVYLTIQTTEATPDYSHFTFNQGDTMLSYEPYELFVEKIKSKKIWAANSDGSQGSGDLMTLIVDLPVSDGSGISSGYAYIDSTDRSVKVKA